MFASDCPTLSQLSPEWTEKDSVGKKVIEQFHKMATAEPNGTCVVVDHEVLTLESTRYPHRGTFFFT